METSEPVICNNEEEQNIPYNENNVLITCEDIEETLKKYEVYVKIKNIKIFRQALTHKSYVKTEFISNEDLHEARKNFSDNVVELQEESNERLELLGDAIIKGIVTHYLYNRYFEEDEGFITRLKTKIENRESLARLARVINLSKYVIISSYVENLGGRNSDKTLEDSFEAFFGALYLDIGFDGCQKFLNKILETKINYSKLLYFDNNYKDQLLKYYHTNKWGHPEYCDISVEGPSNKKVFVRGVKDNEGNVIAKGKGGSKKKAEQIASMNALLKYNVLKEDQILRDESEFVGDDDV